MTRKQFRIQIARVYVLRRYGTHDENAIRTYIAGAKWAERHPLDKPKWRKFAKEKPQPYEDILILLEFADGYRKVSSFIYSPDATPIKKGVMMIDEKLGMVARYWQPMIKVPTRQELELINR